jgi:hypothetical protein
VKNTETFVYVVSKVDPIYTEILAVYETQELAENKIARLKVVKNPFGTYIDAFGKQLVITKLPFHQKHSKP